MKPSDRIVERVRKRGYNPNRLHAHELAVVIFEILNYLDERAEEDNPKEDK